MGHQIIEQPDGLLAVFSSVVGSFVVTDATPEELIDWYAEEAAREARERTKRLLDRVAVGGQVAYGQHALTWEEASQLHQECSSDPDES
ncbi:hypothetical protein OG883_45880 [Streptomyces sp. NBC_01142]|uniref:hypothetical protein n=1 Tax=Streptomyces sp. NBC_01142 TaxID=2975865 RepID=UPI002250C654|nr:hypothetical protein [Streptomyces sp. NBC_01142]MCX4826316.1 hypothetical protein [Streptomyces sp. NBC_01142]MCX4826922.1 hypothetical protein [Streptomyces sp. NBC_01142]MCX4826971.1 hypothetical protein [Streptomyces sp. NBC_01142]